MSDRAERLLSELDKAPNAVERREYQRLLFAAERERMGRKRRIDVDLTGSKGPLQQETLFDNSK